MVFENYYDYLDIPRNADTQTILTAIARERARLAVQINYPDQFAEVTRRTAKLDRIENVMLTPAKKEWYDAQLRQNETAVLYLEGDGLGYRFSADDPDPSQTVPGLAHKLDENWAHGASSGALVSSDAYRQAHGAVLSQALRFEGQHASNRLRDTGATERESERMLKRYNDLADQIDSYNAQYASHPLALLESTITLFDPDIEAPAALIAVAPQSAYAQLSAKTGATLPAREVRPDRPDATQVILYQGPSRGSLFGYCWVEEAWGTLSATGSTVSAPAKKPARVPTSHAIYFEFMDERAAATPHQIALVAQPRAETLLTMPRPATHELTLNFLFQPGTPQEWQTQVKAPFGVTLIPARAIFDPSTIVIPDLARKGEKVQAQATLRNEGEQPLQARPAPVPQGALPPDRRGVAVTFTPDDRAIPVQIVIDTSDLPKGTKYQKTVVFEENGDNKVAQLTIEGELYPSARQAFYRKYNGGARLILAVGFAVIVWLLDLLPVFLMPPTVFWVFSALVVVGAALGLTAMIARNVVRSIQASGDKQISYASIPWPTLLTAVGVSAAVYALVVALALGGVSTRDTVFILTFILLAAIAGYFLV